MTPVRTLLVASVMTVVHSECAPLILIVSHHSSHEPILLMFMNLDCLSNLLISISPTDCYNAQGDIGSNSCIGET